MWRGARGLKEMRGHMNREGGGGGGWWWGIREGDRERIRVELDSFRMLSGPSYQTHTDSRQRIV